MLTQPVNPTQGCTVVRASGTIADAEVTNVSVTCETSMFTVGGRVEGLAGSGLVLRNNGTDDLALDAAGTFTFGTAVASGGTYAVSVAVQPIDPLQVCTVADGAGVVTSGNIEDVVVTCTTIEFTVGGVVSGLRGSGLRLQNNGSGELAIAADGSFTLPVSAPAGAPYDVTVLQQPERPRQVCTVANGAGTLSSGNVLDVAVTCAGD